LRFP
jgi:CheY-like chemotaxis protein